MAETLVKEKVCRTCGADVRPKAVFCYNCGSAVAPSVPLTENSKRPAKKWVENDLAKADSGVVEFKKEARAEKPAAEKAEFQAREDSGKLQTKTAAGEEKGKEDLSKLRSAASMRRRGKSVQKKRVEIVWEEHDNAPNGWFILVAVVLTILAIAIWVISTYLE
jgi:hypothetical protein